MPISDFKVEVPVAPGQSCSLERSIWSWVNAYKVSFSIFALNELGVLGFIAGDFLSSGQIASQLSLSEELLTPLLELLASVGVLQKNDAGFRAPRGIETILPLLTMESGLSADHVTASRIARECDRRSSGLFPVGRCAGIHSCFYFRHALQRAHSCAALAAFR